MIWTTLNTLSLYIIKWNKLKVFLTPVFVFLVNADSHIRHVNERIDEGLTVWTSRRCARRRGQRCLSSSCTGRCASWTGRWRPVGCCAGSTVDRSAGNSGVCSMQLVRWYGEIEQSWSGLYLVVDKSSHCFDFQHVRLVGSELMDQAVGCPVVSTHKHTQKHITN